jgi:hypothetical protein
MTAGKPLLYEYDDGDRFLLHIPPPSSSQVI